MQARTTEQCKQTAFRCGSHEKLLLAVAVLELYVCVRNNKRTNVAGADDEEKHTSVRSILLLALPMSFDLVATLLMSVGLLYVTASIYQMLRGAEILFSALFAVLFLKRKLNKLHYLGIAACTVGIVIVGSSSLLSSDDGKDKSNAMGGDASKVLLGMLLIVLAQVRLPLRLKLAALPWHSCLQTGYYACGLPQPAVQSLAGRAGHCAGSDALPFTIEKASLVMKR